MAKRSPFKKEYSGKSSFELDMEKVHRMSDCAAMTRAKLRENSQSAPRVPQYANMTGRQPSCPPDFRGAAERFTDGTEPRRTSLFIAVTATTLKAADFIPTLARNGGCPPVSGHHVAKIHNNSSGHHRTKDEISALQAVHRQGLHHRNRLHRLDKVKATHYWPGGALRSYATNARFRSAPLRMHTASSFPPAWFTEQDVGCDSPER
jgi:hypothetical protein